MKQRLLKSESETFHFGESLAKLLPKGSVLCLHGDLAAGKTTLVKGLAHALTGISKDHVTSPTFQFLNTYEGKTPVYHFDLYRITAPEDFLLMGFDEMLDADGICCIEWPEKMGDLVPKEAYHLTLKYVDENIRELTYGKGFGS